MKAEDYLDEKFPKGGTKFGGEAMVLLALSKLYERERILNLIDEWWAKRISEEKGGATFQELKDRINEEGEQK